MLTALFSQHMISIIRSKRKKSQHTTKFPKKMLTFLFHVALYGLSCHAETQMSFTASGGGSEVFTSISITLPSTDPSSTAASLFGGESTGSTSGTVPSSAVFPDGMKVADTQVLSNIAQKAPSSLNNEKIFSNESGSGTQVKNSSGIFVPPCANRSFWERHTMPSSFIESVQYFMQTPMPTWSDDTYLALHKNGSRLAEQNMLWSRQGRLFYLVLAECTFYNGTFLKAVESTLAALSEQRSWAYPSADPQLTYFNGTCYFMDLSSASIAGNIGLALYLLENVLSPSTKTIVKNALNTRVFNPLNAVFNGNDCLKGSKWWVSSNSHHNSDTWAGVLIASFSVQNATDRSFLAGKAIRSTKNYLDGFWNDGYPTEGVYFWNQGFSNYELVRQSLYEATVGAYDAFQNRKAVSAALFSKEFGMSFGDAANFGDCPFDTWFNSGAVLYVDRSFQKEPEGSVFMRSIQDVQSESVFTLPTKDNGLRVAYYLLAYYLLSLIPENIPIASAITTTGMATLRHYYNETGVLVVRPNTLNNGEGLYGTIKLCGNFGQHSHDDIGSYVISINSTKLSGDVGGPLYYDYTSFSSQRWKSSLMNSYGHPVPVVNGHLQLRATDVCKNQSNVSVLWKNFTDSTDSIFLDMTGAYNESLLNSLTRSMVYNRLESTLEITDTVNFSQPCKFEDAIVSIKNWTFTSNSTGFFSDKNETLHVTLTSDVPFFLKTTQLSSYGVNFTRIGIQLLSSVSSAKVSMKFSTVYAPTKNLGQQEVLSIMEKVANWQLAQPNFTNSTVYFEYGWEKATAYVGIMELARLSRDDEYLNTLLIMGDRNGWKLGPSTLFADDHCIGQVYCELFLVYKNQTMILPTQSTLNEIVTNPPNMTDLTYSESEWLGSGKWLWADSLFMAPPTFMRLYNATGDTRYLDFVINNWWIVSNFLYDTVEHLFFRDSRFINRRRPESGKKIFWSRGNGWVMAGIVRVLQYLPENHQSRPQFIQQLQEMAEKILVLQQPDGLWRTDLLNYAVFPQKETSGTALLTYAITWGINQGFLNKTTAQPAMLLAWSGLVGCIDSDGKLGYVQSGNVQPANVSSRGTQPYAIGAFLLAGSEVYKMMGDL